MTTDQLIGPKESKYGLMSFISKVSEIYANSTDEWEDTIKKAMRLIGKHFELDQVECVIKSLSKNHRQQINWYYDPNYRSSKVIKEESELIDFLFRNQSEELFYYKSIVKNTPQQLKKIFRIKKVKSVVILKMEFNGKQIGHILLGYCHESKCLTDDDLRLIKSFSSMTTIYILNQQQALTIKKLAEKNGEQDRRLKEFAFITSHHLRAFSSNLASLTEYLLINPNEQRFIEMISSSVKKLNGSIENINGILTHENDLLPEELSRVKLNNVMNKVLGWHKKAIGTNEIRVENLLPKRLSIFSQQEMLENIFSHIFSNAIKYGTNQKSKIIRIDHAENEDYLIVRIRDFGDGIDMNKYGNKLFKAGSRFSSESNSSLGMGLFLSKFQIQKLGGRIHLKSEPGKGTSVQCYLPHKVL